MKVHDILNAHFYCDACEMVKCMEEIPVKHYQMPNGYLNNETEVMIKGRCPNCM
ncbi:hypothetical protein [Carboxylicivirga sp. N1Y90]|uniref:hypothetical protein n=1 Tax=Carboxylicivirga fragile TaxID=3417571 RepID=UPI003D335FB3|nr:hypothetical protein [Marinilabiliaceae bacterium N1Y90]